MGHDSICETLKSKPLSQLSSEEMREARELAYSILRADYYRDIRGIAEDVKSCVESGELADREAVDTYVHETVDGCGRVIYTREAQEAVMLSDNGDSMIENCGTDGVVSDGSICWSQMAYFAVRDDVMEQLQAEGIDSDYWDNLETEEETEDTATTE
jgi:hypothetical protein